MTDVIVRVLSGGRVTIPEAMRKAAKVDVGDFMIIKQFYGEITLTVAKVEPRKRKSR
jgi:bifunctional DNA-binding transcriptional regulator/antitoxin component of YhaV-PrlF toxin-antitoxin module